VNLYEELYSVVERCNITYTEVWRMPVELRRWWLNKKHKEDKNKPADH
jgi:hypothetical protein